MPNTPTVATAMTEPVVTAGPTETLGAVARRMHEHRIGSVVVVEGNRPIGIATERDLLRATAASADPAHALVRDWMVPDPDCVGVDSAIDQAWQQLAERGYRHIPVVAGDELKGIVSLRDLTAHAQLRPAGEPAAVAPPGLKGVVVAETALGDVRGGEGFYHYRQYAAPELAAARGFEDVWHLLIDGTLPTRDRARRLRRRGRTAPGAPARRPRRAARRRHEHRGAGRRPADRHLPARRGRGPSRIAGRRRRADAHRRAAAQRRSAHPDRRDPPAPPRPRADRSPRRPALRRQLPAHDRRLGAGPRAGAGGRAVPHPRRRPRLQRLDVRGPRGHVHRRRPRCRRRRRARPRSPAPSTAARRAGPSTPSTPSAGPS